MLPRTTDTATAVPVYLSDVSKKDRTIILAMHEDFTRTEKANILQKQVTQHNLELKESEDMKQIDWQELGQMDSVIALAVRIINKTRQRSAHKDGCDDHHQHEPSSTLPSNFIGIESTPQGSMSLSNKGNKRCRDDASNPNLAEGLDPLPPPLEPRILRRSIYEKFVKQIEIFLNEQDSFGLTRLLFYPLCGHDGSYLTANQKVWRRVSCASNGNNAVTAPLSTLSLVSERFLANLNELNRNMEHQMKAFPDGVMIHGHTQIRRPLDGGVVSITPFTFFGTVSMQKNITTSFPALEHYYTERSSTATVAKHLEVMFEGYTLVYYDNNDKLVKVDSRAILKQ